MCGEGFEAGEVLPAFGVRGVFEDFGGSGEVEEVVLELGAKGGNLRGEGAGPVGGGVGWLFGEEGWEGVWVGF